MNVQEICRRLVSLVLEPGQHRTDEVFFVGEAREYNSRHVKENEADSHVCENLMKFLKTRRFLTKGGERSGRHINAASHSATAHEGLADAAQHAQGGPLDEVRKPV
jgi:hypothetical protein